ncbi:MAG: hypothetical protein EAZ43_07860 [Betaproteobacteria bacterium]|nr:MAG: hypothetical protein EAZ43_07860 [Betaproteobacteria bacterium]
MNLSHPNLVALFISTLIVTGCVDEQRIRELSREMTHNIKLNSARSYVAVREATRKELQTRSPCCDDLSIVRASVKFRFDNATSTVGVGSMLDNRVVEIDGYRSFYGMFDLNGPLDGKQMIDVSLMATPGYADPETLETAATILFPDFLYLDSQRREISRTQLTPSGNGHRIGGVIYAPAGTQFIVVYSSKASVAARPLRAWFAGATSAMPIGGSFVAIRTPPREEVFLPADKGSVTLTLLP